MTAADSLRWQSSNGERGFQCANAVDFALFRFRLSSSQMLRHAGFLDFLELRLPALESQTNPEGAWKVWKEYESRSR